MSPVGRGSWAIISVCISRRSSRLYAANWGFVGFGRKFGISTERNKTTTLGAGLFIATRLLLRKAGVSGGRAGIRASDGGHTGSVRTKCRIAPLRRRAQLWCQVFVTFTTMNKLQLKTLLLLWRGGGQICWIGLRCRVTVHPSPLYLLDRGLYPILVERVGNADSAFKNHVPYKGVCWIWKNGYNHDCVYNGNVNKRCFSIWKLFHG